MGKRPELTKEERDRIDDIVEALKAARESRDYVICAERILYGQDTGSHLNISAMDAEAFLLHLIVSKFNVDQSSDMVRASLGLIAGYQDIDEDPGSKSFDIGKRRKKYLAESDYCRDKSSIPWDDPAQMNNLMDKMGKKEATRYRAIAKYYATKYKNRAAGERFLEQAKAKYLSKDGNHIKYPEPSYKKQIILSGKICPVKKRPCPLQRSKRLLSLTALWLSP